MRQHTRVLIFDADGVLIRPWGFAAELESRHGISRSRTADFFAGPFRDCLAGTQDLYEALPPYLSRWRWPGSLHDFVELWMKADDRPARAVLRAITALRRRGDLLCVASNQERIRARYIAGEMGFSRRFDRLYFSCDLGVLKPDPDYYRAIQRDLRARPDRIFFWDDSESHVAAALKLGWNARVFTPRRRLAGGLARSLFSSDRQDT